MPLRALGARRPGRPRPARRGAPAARAAHNPEENGNNNGGGRDPLGSSSGRCTLRVAITKHVPFGASLRLVGAEEGVGAWDPALGVDMVWTEGDVWTCEVSLLSLPPDELVEYKYVVVHPSGALEWQEGPNRILHAEPPACDIRDTWVHERGECLAMLERAVEGEEAEGFEPASPDPAPAAEEDALPLDEPLDEVRRMRENLASLEAALEREEQQYLEHWRRLNANRDDLEASTSYDIAAAEEQADEALLQQAAAISALEAERELFLDRLAEQERELKEKDSALSKLQAELRVAARARAALAAQLVQKRCAEDSTSEGNGEEEREPATTSQRKEPEPAAAASNVVAHSMTVRTTIGTTTEVRDVMPWQGIGDWVAPADTGGGAWPGSETAAAAAAAATAAATHAASAAENAKLRALMQRRREREIRNRHGLA